MFAKTFTGATVSINIAQSEKVAVVRKAITQQFGVSDFNPLLIFKCKVLQDQESLHQAGIRENSTIHVSTRCTGYFSKITP